MSEGKNRKFTIPFRLPSLNDYILKCRTNKYTGGKFKKDTDDSIIKVLENQMVDEFDEFPAILNIVYYERDRRRDIDNILSGKKYILDAMQKCEIIKNDGQKQIRGFNETVRYDKDNPRVEVRIVPIKDTYEYVSKSNIKEEVK